MTSFFIQRLFAQHCSGSHVRRAGGNGSKSAGVSEGMDFARFVTFVAAWEDRSHPASIKYFFPLLDLQGRGYIDQVRKALANAGRLLGPSVGLFPPFSLERAQAGLLPVLASIWVEKDRPLLLQLDIYTLFREVFQLWVELGQYTGELARVPRQHFQKNSEALKVEQASYALGELPDSSLPLLNLPHSSLQPL
jgi:hypothetical protein